MSKILYLWCVSCLLPFILSKLPPYYFICVVHIKSCILFVCSNIISKVNSPCLATGDWRAQCVPCGGGYLPGVLRLGTAHHSHAYGKPDLLHLPHSQFQIRANYEPWMFAFILPSFCIHNKEWHFPLPGSEEPCTNLWINESWSDGEGRIMHSVLVDEGCIVSTESNEPSHIKTTSNGIMLIMTFLFWRLTGRFVRPHGCKWSWSCDLLCNVVPVVFMPVSMILLLTLYPVQSQHAAQSAICKTFCLKVICGFECNWCFLMIYTACKVELQFPFLESCVN